MPDAVREAREEGLRQMNPQARAIWGRIPLADSLPTHHELLVDRAGNLWVKGYVVLDEEPYWMVFDEEGRWLGDFPQPEGPRITEVGEDHLLGIHADTLGVQRAHLDGLEKGPAN